MKKFYEKELIYEKRKEKNNKMTPNLKFLENQTLIFRKFLREKHKEDTKLRIFKDQKETKNMQIRKLKEKTKSCN